MDNRKMKLIKKLNLMLLSKKCNKLMRIIDIKYRKFYAVLKVEDIVYSDGYVRDTFLVPNSIFRDNKKLVNHLINVVSGESI